MFHPYSIPTQDFLGCVAVYQSACELPLHAIPGVAASQNETKLKNTPSHNETVLGTSGAYMSRNENVEPSLKLATVSADKVV